MRIIANMIAAGAAAALFAPSSLFAQGEAESDIQFAPDDTGADALLAPPPPAGSAAPASPAAAGAPPAAAGAEAPAAEAASPAAAGAEAQADTAGGPDASAGGGLITPRPPTDTRIFGRYRVRISVARPRFDDGLEFYDRLYGDEKAYPQFQADWFAWDWYATLGLSFRFAYYSAEGHAAKVNKPKNDVVASDFDGAEPGARQDDAGPTTLTLVPVQVLAATEFTPFDRKWIVVDAYAGLEYLYWQEVRTKAQSSSSPTATGGGTTTGSSPTASMMLLAAEGDGEDDGYTNTGFKTSSVFGLGLNILLNGLDERSVASMRGSMGLGYVYLSPFVEVVRQLGDGASFGRTLVGLGFTFESLR